MSKVYNSAVVIIPTQDKWESIQEIREKYDRQINRWMPHITLIYPFRPKNRFDNLEARFSEICSHLNAFEMKLRKFRYFEHRHNNYTLWLDPEPNNTIQQLQLEILKLVPDCNDINKFKDGFHPHLSVGQIQGLNNLKFTLHALQKTWKGLSFECKEIYFISRENEKSSRFKIENTIPLKI